MLKRFQVPLFALLFVLALSAPCGATELVTNGGFETGNFSSWTVTPAAQGSFIGVNTADPHAGVYAAAFGANRSQDDSISQTLVTGPGQLYTFSFWLAHPYTTAANDNDFHVFWDGGQVLSTNGAANFGYIQFTFNLTASTSSTPIVFSGFENPAWFYLDDVSVTGPQSVPEPASLLLFGFGLVGLAGVRRMMRGMQFKTNITEGTMKTHLRLAVMICGLLLVAAPAMAQTLSSIQISDDDTNGISALISPGTSVFSSQLVIIQEANNQQGSVTWNFGYITSLPAATYSYNIYEPGTNLQNPPASALSDTLQFTRDAGGPVGSHGSLVFVSGSRNDTPALNPLPGGFTIIETGGLQDLLLLPDYPTDISVQFQSDSDPTSVPEPASLLLFGFGLVGLAGVRRFK